MIFILIVALILLALIILFVVIGTICNRTLKSTEYEVQSEKLPKEFENFKILQISDLHNCAYSKGNRKLIELAKNAKPDVIAITGDMIDSRKTKPEVSLALAKEFVKIAPCYYVTGNHEARIKEKAEEFIEKLIKAGVTYLDNKAVEITRQSESILLLGVKDPFHYWLPEKFNKPEIMRNNLRKITCPDERRFRILLSHRPEVFDVYKDFRIDLTLAGHAHGGQIRLPFIGGLFAPCQGFFPKLTSGHHNKDNSHLIVSRGLGNSSFPLRLFNPPESVIVTLKNKS